MFRFEQRVIRSSLILPTQLCGTYKLQAVLSAIVVGVAARQRTHVRGQHSVQNFEKDQ